MKISFTLLLSVSLMAFNAYGRVQEKGASNTDRRLLTEIYSAIPKADSFPHERKASFRFKNKEAKAIATLVSQAETHYNEAGSDSTSIAEMKKAISLLETQNYPLTEAYLNYRLGRMLYEAGKYTLGVEHLLYAKEMIQESDYNSVPYVGSFLSFLGGIYCIYNNYELGLQYLLQSRSHPFHSKRDVYYMYGNIGLAYYKLNNADSSVWGSKKALDVAYEIKDSAEIGNMLGNLGAAYLLKKDYPSAIVHLQKDFNINSHLKEWVNASGALLLQTRAYLMMGKTKTAFKNIEKEDSIFHICNSCATASALREYYLNRSTYYRLKGDFKSTVNALDSFQKYMEISNNRHDISVFKNMELDVAERIHKTKMTLLESERKRQLLIRRVIIAFSCFVLILIGLLLYIQLRKRKTERHVHQLQMKNAEARLKTYLENIKGKNKLLEQLRKELEKMQRSRISSKALEKDDEKEIEILHKIKEASLVTEEGWQEFTELVELVHHHFFTRLRKRYPGLTPAEIRILTLIKLNFSIKEMAGMLGISPDSVRKSKYRVRKKLNLAEVENLEDLIKRI